jgi:hypothetical protein
LNYFLQYVNGRGINYTDEKAKLYELKYTLHKHIGVHMRLSEVRSEAVAINYRAQHGRLDG